jgi:hypothetical protein
MINDAQQEVGRSVEAMRPLACSNWSPRGAPRTMAMLNSRCRAPLRPERICKEVNRSPLSG